MVKALIGALIGLCLVLGVTLAPAMATSPAVGEQSFTEYEAFLHPAQEPDPNLTSQAKGYGRLRFPKNLSASTIEVDLEGVDASKVTAFHLHCGSPGVLGPIIVDLGQFGDLSRTLSSGHLSATVVNQGLTFVKQPPLPPTPGSGPLTLPLPEGCPSNINFPVQQVNTVAGLEALARNGALYFNLHTVGHEFYGEIRGQVYPVNRE
jgi:CHRD domain